VLGAKERSVRVHFKLEEFEPFKITIDGVEYPYKSLRPLAKKERLTTNVHEYVYQLPTNKYVYLTVVGDEDQPSAFGLTRGWYVAEIISKDDAEWLIQSLAPFTAMYEQ
jgi:hypothetical protein